MIPQSTDSIATVKYDGQAWRTVLQSLNKELYIHQVVFATKKTAQVAAKAWAEKNKFVYVGPQKYFVTVISNTSERGGMRISMPTFSIALINSEKNMMTAGTRFISFSGAMKEAAKIANSQHKPFVPNFAVLTTSSNNC